mgnify:CR=1 FL=1
MAGITQTIPNFNGGISEQPDQLKKPGQVKDAVNVVPDPVWGLYKRPGAKRITTNGDALPNVSSNAASTWFHYYRDPTEGSYIGQIAQDGDVRVWNCKSGKEATTYYKGATGTTAYGAGTEKTYLTHTAKEQIQSSTIFDTTFITNRSVTTALTAATATAKVHPHYAYIDLLRTENGRQYALNVYDADTVYDYRRATSIELGGEGDQDTVDNTGTHERNDTLGDGSGSGTCRGIGTQVIYYNGGGTAPAKKRNLIFRLTITGQSGLKAGAQPDNNGSFDADDYKCTYHRDLTLLHGGEGWTRKYTTTPLRWLSSTGADDLGNGGLLNNNQPTDQGTIDGYTGYWSNSDTHEYHNANGTGANRVAMTNCKYGAHDGHPAQYRIRVTDDEIIKTKGYLNGNPVGIIRPKPTPFDADTAVTAETILAGIMGEIDHNTFTGTGSDGAATYSLKDSGIEAKIIGTGLYLYTTDANNNFSVEILENDLMRVMQDTVNDVSKLPIQCKHGYIVKVTNSEDADDDDYWLRFQGDNDLDGPGTWVECAEPGVKTTFDNTTLPLVIQRNSYDTDTKNFTIRIKHWDYKTRTVGDDNTNAQPDFVGKAINKTLFFRNRLAFLSGDSVILSRPGTITEPDFWNMTALTTSATDPINISAAGSFPTTFFDGIETNTGLLCMSRTQQFLLASDDTIMNPDTVKLRSISSYFYDETTPPISLGTTFGFIDTSGKYSRFQELNGVAREGEASIFETSGLVPTLLPKDIDLISASRENGMVFLGKSGTDTIYIYKYENRQAGGGLQRVQGSWVKWKFLNPVQYHFAMDDSYYFVDDENFLQKINIVNSSPNPDNDIMITQNEEDYLVHLDNWIESTGSSNSYNATTDQTTFTFSWLPSSVDYVYGTDPVLAAFSTDMSSGTQADISTHEEATGTVRYGIYAEAVSRSGTTVVFPGKWGSANGKYPFVGWVYKYQVDLPTLYATKQIGDGQFRSDVNASLILHRLKLNFGKVGVYETTLTRVGKDDYTELHESGEASLYHASDMPWVEEDIKTIPVYERNINVDVRIKSSHPSPATLHSLSWEGDFSKLNYRRV